MQILMPEVNKDSIRNRLVKWLKNEKDEVKAGEEIALIENQRVTSVIKSAFSGRLINIAAENSFIDVGQQVAEVLEDDPLKESSLPDVVATDGETEGDDLQVNFVKEDQPLIAVKDSLNFRCKVDISKSLYFVFDNSIDFSSYLFFCISKAYSKYPFLGRKYPVNFYKLSENGLENVNSYSEDLLKKIELAGLSSLDEFFNRKRKNIDFSTSENFNVIYCEDMSLENIQITFSKKNSAILTCAYDIPENFDDDSKEECSLFFSSNFGGNLSDFLNFLRKLKGFLTKPENLIL
ncbi:biotin/lipoyl-containing protein [Thermodesulfobium sp. 4217-1]|uniref:biotin/lipoyl-containing protein n=1 Tax=Thermodesulfobium sp. 4217-1 TaxID=3120013 RepID=UPI003221D4B9